MIVTRRGLAAFVAFLAATLTGSAVAAESAADAISTGHGGAKVACVLRFYSYPQYGISGVISKCGPGWHEGGPQQ